MLQRFAPPPHLTDETAFGGVSSRGEVAGTFTAAGQRLGFIRSAAGVYVTFALPTGVDLTIDSINNRGDVAGKSFSSDLRRYVLFLGLTTGELREIAIPFTLQFGPFFRPIALDDRGVLLFQATDADPGVFEAVIATPSG